MSTDFPSLLFFNHTLLSVLQMGHFTMKEVTPISSPFASSHPLFPFHSKTPSGAVHFELAHFIQIIKLPIFIIMFRNDKFNLGSDWSLD